MIDLMLPKKIRKTKGTTVIVENKSCSDLIILILQKKIFKIALINLKKISFEIFI